MLCDTSKITNSPRLTQGLDTGDPAHVTFRSSRNRARVWSTTRARNKGA